MQYLFGSDSIDKLNISVRSKNGLHRMGIYNIESLLSMSEQELINTRNIGQKSIEEINSIINMMKMSNEDYCYKECENKDIEIKEAYEKIYIEELELSTSTYNALKRTGVNTLADLIRKEQTDLEDEKGFGRSKLKEVQYVLKSLVGGYVEENSGNHNPSIDVLNRPVTSLNVSPRTINALVRGGVKSVGEVLSMSKEEIFNLRNMGWKSYCELTEIMKAIRMNDESCFIQSDEISEYPKRDYDIEIIKLLKSEYGLKFAWLCEWFGVSRQNVDRKLKNKRNKGHWCDREYTDDENRIVCQMIYDKLFYYEEDGRRVYLLNNKLDDCAIIFVDQEEIKCFFLENLPEEIQNRIKAEKMHILSEDEFGDWVKGTFVSILHKDSFIPSDAIHFRQLALSREMTIEEYSQFLYGVPYSTGQHSVTDEKIVEFLERNIMNGKVYISTTPDTQWIRSFISRNGFSIDEFIDFYGYKSATSVEEAAEIDDSGLFETVENDMRVYDCEGKFAEKVFARNPLIGNERISEKNLETLYKNVKSYIDQKIIDNNKQFTLDHDMQITLAVINYAKNWINEDYSGFWRYITSQFGYRDENGRVRNLICSSVKNAMIKNKRWFVVTNTGYQYKSTIVIHALTTKRTWMDFYDFLFDFYKNNLDWEYIENDPIIERMIISLGNKLSLSDDESVEDIEISNKVYWFQEGIRKLITMKPHYAALVMSAMIQRIDMLINHDERPAKCYLEDLGDEWMANKLRGLSSAGRTRQADERRNVAIDYTRIRPLYQLNNEDTVVISFPDVRLEKNDFSYIKLSVSNNSERIICERSLEFYGNELGKTMKGFNLNLDEILHKSSEKFFNISITISCDGAEIYNSGTSLYRECLCFDGRREIGIESCQSRAYSLFFLGGSVIGIENAEVSVIKDNVNERAYFVQLQDNFVIKLNEKLLAFDCEDDDGISVKMPRIKNNVEYIENGYRYGIIGANSDVHIIIGENYDYKKLRILLNGQNINLGNLNSEVLGNRTVYSMPLDGTEGENINLQVIDLLSGRILARKNFIMINKLSYQFNRPFYFASNDYQDAFVIVNTDKISNNKVVFNKGDHSVNIQYSSGEIEIHIPQIKVRDNYNNEWNEEKEYWIKDIIQNFFLYFNQPNDINIKLLLDEKEVAIENSDAYALGNAVTALEVQDDKKWAMLEMVVGSNGFQQKYLIGRISLKEQFSKIPKIYLDDNNLMWDKGYRFLGNTNSSIQISIVDENGEKSDYPIDLDSECISENIVLETGEYQYEIYKRSENIFTIDKMVLAKGIIYIGDENELRFRNRRIVIQKVTYEDFCNDDIEVVSIKASYIDTLHFEGIQYVPSEERECPIYTGVMFFISDNSKKRKEYSYIEGDSPEAFSVYKVNPVKVVYINETTISITNEDDDGLMYQSMFDKVNHGIIYFITDWNPDAPSNRRYKDHYYLADLYSYTTERI